MSGGISTSEIQWIIGSECGCTDDTHKGAAKDIYNLFLERGWTPPNGRHLGGEHCQDCGRAEDWSLIWQAPDELWLHLVGQFRGLLCPPCFNARAQAAGIYLRWVPTVDWVNWPDIPDAHPEQHDRWPVHAALQSALTAEGVPS